jgi:hypothetical protein
MPYLLSNNITKTHECLELALAKGFKFAGIYKTSYCFASNTAPFSEGSSTSCNSQCSVQGEVCGSDESANSIYSLPGLSEYKDIGCYNVEGSSTELA